MRQAGMERSQFWATKSLLESVLAMKSEVGWMEISRSCAKRSGLGFWSSVIEAGRLFPRSKE